MKPVLLLLMMHSKTLLKAASLLAPQTRSFFCIVPQNCRGIRLNFGRFSTSLEPGIRLELPFYHNILLLDIREKIETIPTVRAISSDSVTFSVDASVQFKIVDTKKALLNVRDAGAELIEKCKMELRGHLSLATITEILQRKTEISKTVLDSVTPTALEWGIEVSSIQIKDIEFDESMKNAMTTVAEATRHAEAKVINARSDVETAKQYNEAAKIYSENPLTMRLREFQLWQSVSKNECATVYVVPSNLLDFMGSAKGNTPSQPQVTPPGPSILEVE